jgi:hypothetical protein
VRKWVEATLSGTEAFSRLFFISQLFLMVCTMDFKQILSSSIHTQRMMVSQLPTPKNAIHSILDLLSTAEQTRSSGGNETSLLTLCSVS